MAKKFYVVWQGRETGVFTDWETCKKHIDRYAGARYKSFKTRAEAESAFRSGHAAAKTSTKTPHRRTSGKGLPTLTADAVDKLDIRTKIFTDGGCEPNPGQAGSGVAVYRDGDLAELWYGLYTPHGTNNTAELNALHQALLMAQREIAQANTVAIFCDSKYAIQCITQWAVNWEKKGWRKPGGEIKNLALIQQIFTLYTALENNVRILHVNGHVGVEGNEMADRMSIQAIDQKEESLVSHPVPTDITAILAMRTG